MATIRSAARLSAWKDEAKKNAAAALVIVTTLVTSPPVEAQDRVSVGTVVSSTTAGLIASAQVYSSEYGRAVYLGAAPAIFGYGYRATYYGHGFSYQPAYYPGYAYYARPRFRGCCRW
jgi:hypothetical protein